MPNSPNLDGLPLWFQVIASLIFLGLSIIIGLRGYRSPPPKSEQTLVAHLADMGPVRHLADVCLSLAGDIQSLERVLVEHTHHLRNHYEITRELAQRTREMCEKADRFDRK